MPNITKKDLETLDRVFDNLWRETKPESRDNLLEQVCKVDRIMISLYRKIKVENAKAKERKARKNDNNIN